MPQKIAILLDIWHRDNTTLEGWYTLPSIKPILHYFVDNCFEYIVFNLCSSQSSRVQSDLGDYYVLIINLLDAAPVGRLFSFDKKAYASNFRRFVETNAENGKNAPD